MTLTNFTAEDFKEHESEQMEILESIKSTPELSGEKVESSTPIIAAGASPDDVPAGTVKEILTWVEEEATKAQKALDAELESDKPRKGLLETLTEIIDAHAEEN